MFTNLKRAAGKRGGLGAGRASRRLARLPGFTLIEVIIGLTILSMITGTLFAIIKGAVSGAADIERVQRENDSVNRLIELFRQTFQTMPSTGTLTLKITQQTDPVMQELTIGSAPHSFAFGTSPISYKDNIIGLQADAAQTTSAESGLPRYNLSLSREDLIPKTDDNQMSVRQDVNSVTAPDAEGRYWMPLLPAVTSLSWKFYKLSDDTWVEEWSESKWPDLIEMNLVMEGRTLPIRSVFSVPVLAIRAGSGRSGSSSAPTPAPGGGAAPTGGGTAPTGGGGAPTGGGAGGGSTQPTGR